MKTHLLPLTLSAALALPLPGAASDVDHFQGKSVHTLDEAVTTFNESNAQLERLLAGELDAKVVSDIHQLSYTLENSLIKIQTEASNIAVLLEEVHQASERNDAAAVKRHGESYLKWAKRLIP